MNKSTEHFQSSGTRVLVALDDAAGGGAALEAAARLAADLRAELRGLFIEDIDAVRAANLPFVTEIAIASATARPLDTRSIERALRQKAALVRTRMGRLAEQAHVTWSFAVARGRVTQRVLADATESDVVILGPRGHAPAAQPPTQDTGRRRTWSVATVFDGTQRACETLTTAAIVAQHLDGPVDVLVYAPDRSTGCRRQLDAIQWLAHHGPGATAWATIVGTPAEVQEAARGRAHYLLLLARDCSLLADVTVQWLVENLGCTIGLM